MKRKLFAIFIAMVILSQTGCNNKSISTSVAGKEITSNKSVKISNKGNYYEVTLDFSSGSSHREIGSQYGEAILEALPNYESLVDSYLRELIKDNQLDESLLRIKDIKSQVNKDYIEEIEGIASKFSGGTENILGDNKLSKDEFLLFNLIPDVLRSVQCSVVSVFGDRSETKKTMIARNLDWYNGEKNQTPQFQAVITYKNKNSTICSIGYMGYLGILTGFNQNGIFAAILDSATGASYSSINKFSYPMDLRYALENNNKLEDIADFMKDPGRSYTFNHNVALADTNTCKILENNFSGSGTIKNQRIRRDLRTSESELNEGVEWGISNAVASVNSFILKGNFDNHTKKDVNKKRWDNMRKELLSKGDVVTFDELKQVIEFDDGTPGTMQDSGDLYNKMTQQSIIFQPDTFNLEVFFHPKDKRDVPNDPTYEKVDVKIRSQR